MQANLFSAGLICVVAGVLSACQPVPTEPAPTATVAPSTEAVTAVANPRVTQAFSGGGGNWEGGGGIMFRYTAIERDGEIYICGAYSRQGLSGTSRLGREVMRQAVVISNGERIMRNMAHFNAVSNSNWSSRLVGVETNCRSTGRAAGTLDLNSLEVSTRDGSYRIRT